MFNINITVNNIISPIGEFKNYFCKEGVIPRFVNKCYCAQISYDPYTFLHASVDIVWKGCDHAGPHIEITVCGVTLELSLYDKRHWDDDNDCWETYDAPIV